MKNIIISLLFIAGCLSKSTGQGVDGIPDLLKKNGKELGLVSYLTFVKSVSELNMLRLYENPKYKTKQFKINSQYNLIKLYSDQLINQMSVDLYSSNRLKTYKKINYFLKTPNEKLNGDLVKYGNLIKQIDNNLTDFLSIDFGPGKAIATIAEITGVLELGHTAITDARDFREKKIQSITALMKELKLSTIAELKPEEEKKAK
jgi:hypothetical protein